MLGGFRGLEASQCRVSRVFGLRVYTNGSVPVSQSYEDRKKWMGNNPANYRTAVKEPFLKTYSIQ